VADYNKVIDKFLTNKLLSDDIKEDVAKCYIKDRSMYRNLWNKAVKLYQEDKKNQAEELAAPYGGLRELHLKAFGRHARFGAHLRG